MKRVDTTFWITPFVCIRIDGKGETFHDAYSDQANHCGRLIARLSRIQSKAQENAKAALRIAEEKLEADGGVYSDDEQNHNP